MWSTTTPNEDTPCQGSKMQNIRSLSSRGAWFSREDRKLTKMTTAAGAIWKRLESRLRERLSDYLKGKWTNNGNSVQLLLWGKQRKKCFLVQEWKGKLRKWHWAGPGSMSPSEKLQNTAQHSEMRGFHEEERKRQPQEIMLRDQNHIRLKKDLRCQFELSLADNGRRFKKGIG